MSLTNKDTALYMSNYQHIVFLMLREKTVSFLKDCCQSCSCLNSNFVLKTHKSMQIIFQKLKNQLTCCQALFCLCLVVTNLTVPKKIKGKRHEQDISYFSSPHQGRIFCQRDFLIRFRVGYTKEITLSQKLLWAETFAHAKNMTFLPKPLRFRRFLAFFCSNFCDQ